MDSRKIDNETELTSTMGNVLSTSINEEKSDTGDATPTSSTDANTSSTSSKIVSDDPISSTSSDVEQKKPPVVSVMIKSPDEESNVSSMEHVADLLEMNINEVSTEKITEDVEDLVHDLESLLGEPTDVYIAPSKNKKVTKSGQPQNVEPKCGVHKPSADEIETASHKKKQPGVSAEVDKSEPVNTSEEITSPQADDPKNHSEAEPIQQNKYLPEETKNINEDTSQEEILTKSSEIDMVKVCHGSGKKQIIDVINKNCPNSLDTIVGEGISEIISICVDSQNKDLNEEFQHKIQVVDKSENIGDKSPTEIRELPSQPDVTMTLITNTIDTVDEKCSKVDDGIKKDVNPECSDSFELNKVVESHSNELPEATAIETHENYFNIANLNEGKKSTSVINITIDSHTDIKYLDTENLEESEDNCLRLLSQDDSKKDDIEVLEEKNTVDNDIPISECAESKKAGVSDKEMALPVTVASKEQDSIIGTKEQSPENRTENVIQDSVQICNKNYPNEPVRTKQDASEIMSFEVDQNEEALPTADLVVDITERLDDNKSHLGQAFVKSNSLLGDGKESESRESVTIVEITKELPIKGTIYENNETDNDEKQDLGCEYQEENKEKSLVVIKTNNDESQISNLDSQCLREPSVESQDQMISSNTVKDIQIGIDSKECLGINDKNTSASGHENSPTETLVADENFLSIKPGIDNNLKDKVEEVITQSQVVSSKKKQADEVLGEEIAQTNIKDISASHNLIPSEFQTNQDAVDVTLADDHNTCVYRIDATEPEVDVKKIENDKTSNIDKDIPKVIDSTNEPSEEFMRTILENVKSDNIDTEATDEEANLLGTDKSANTMDEEQAEFIRTVDDNLIQIVKIVNNKPTEIIKTVDEYQAELVKSVDDELTQIIKTVEEPNSVSTKSGDDEISSLVVEVDNNYEDMIPILAVEPGDECSPNLDETIHIQRTGLEEIAESEDTQEILDAVSNLNQINEQTGTSKHKLSEKERIEMEALRKAVESITGPPETAYDNEDDIIQSGNPPENSVQETNRQESDEMVEEPVESATLSEKSLDSAEEQVKDIDDSQSVKNIEARIVSNEVIQEEDIPDVSVSEAKVSLPGQDMNTESKEEFKASSEVARIDTDETEHVVLDVEDQEHSFKPKTKKTRRNHLSDYETKEVSGDPPNATYALSIKPQDDKDVTLAENKNSLPDSSLPSREETQTEKEIKVKTSRKHRKLLVEGKLEELSINVDVPERDKSYSPKVTIKPIKAPDEEVNITSSTDSEVQKGSLKMTITKQSDKMHSILKICDAENPDITLEEEEPIPKLKIKSIVQSSEQHSPKMSTRSAKHLYSPTGPVHRASSPRITIKIGGMKADEVSPKMTDACSSPKKVIIKPVVKPTDESEQVHSPRITIRPIPKPDSESVTVVKLNTKVGRKDDENPEQEKGRSSPKVTIKPIVKPLSPDAQYIDVEEEVKERIVLKINKGNLPTPTKEIKKREYQNEEEKSENWARITVKLSKEGGHPHIVQQNDESYKRFHEEQSLEKVKKQKLEAESSTPVRAKYKEVSTESNSIYATKHRDPLAPDCPIDNKKSKVKDSAEDIGISDILKSKLEDDDVHIIENKLNSPIVISEDSRSQDSGSCIIIEDSKDTPMFGHQVMQEEIPINPSPMLAVQPITSTPPSGPRKRGRPRKVPLQVREEFKEQISTTPEVSKPMQALHDSGRPKRSCRGQSARDALGIKPRKPRGPGRGRGSKRGMGNRGEIDKDLIGGLLSFEHMQSTESKGKTLLGQPIDGQSVMLVKKIQDNIGGELSSNVSLLSEKVDNDIDIIEIDDQDKPKKNPKERKFSIGKKSPASGVSESACGNQLLSIELVATPLETLTDPAHLSTVLSDPHPESQSVTDNPDTQVLSADSAVVSSTSLSSEVVMVDEDTRMSAESNSRAHTPAKQMVAAPTEIIVEESQSSIQSSATTGSGKTPASKAIKGSRFEVSEPECAIISADQLSEYYWNGQGPFMLQEQVAQYLGIKSFKRKYPGLKRRMVDMQERDFIRESGLASEHMCDLGLTAVNSADILDIMYSDFQEKYEEYCKHQRDRQNKEMINKQKALSLAASQEKNKADITDQAVHSAAQWNAIFNKTRKEQRRACMDLQTYTIQYPKGKMKEIPKSKVGIYPVALVPGQFTDYYAEFTPNEINNLPINTVLYDPVRMVPAEDSDNSGTDGSSSESDSSSSSSDSDSDSSSGIEDCKMCKHSTNKKVIAGK